MPKAHNAAGDVDGLVAILTEPSGAVAGRWRDLASLHPRGGQMQLPSEKDS